jgi:hypothetical protein
MRCGAIRGTCRNAGRGKTPGSSLSLSCGPEERGMRHWPDCQTGQVIKTWCSATLT